MVFVTALSILEILEAMWMGGIGFRLRPTTNHMPLRATKRNRDTLEAAEDVQSVDLCPWRVPRTWGTAVALPSYIQDQNWRIASSKLSPPMLSQSDDKSWDGRLYTSFHENKLLKLCSLEGLGWSLWQLCLFLKYWKPCEWGGSGFVSDQQRITCHSGLQIAIATRLKRQKMCRVWICAHGVCRGHEVQPSHCRHISRTKTEGLRPVSCHHLCCPKAMIRSEMGDFTPRFMKTSC